MRLNSIIVLLFLCTGMQAQINYPRASPLAVVEQQLGLSKITVVYSRPGVKGRKIIGDLVPYGRIWRVGANESTKFTIDSPITIPGHIIPAGTYALYAFPFSEHWEIVFHTNTAHWGDGRDAYKPEEDYLRISVVPEKIAELQENFLISFDRIDHNGMDMLWQWEYTRIRIPIEVGTVQMMKAEISKQIELNPSAQTFYEAARYYQEQGIEAGTALQYLNRALELGGDTYYFHRVKSLVEASLGAYEDAINSAKTSLQLAKALGKDEFVRMNQKNIEHWEKILRKEE